MDTNKLFCYGILKRDKALPLHKEGATFFSEAFIPDARLFRIGGGVGLRLNEDPIVGGNDARGEVFEIPDHMWPMLDRLENNGHVYTRKVVAVAVPTKDGAETVPAWVYEHTMWEPEFYRHSLRVIENGSY